MSLSERGYDIGSAPGWGLLDECQDTGEGVTDVFKLIIEVLAVLCEPVLGELEQMAWQRYSKKHQPSKMAGVF